MAAKSEKKVTNARVTPQVKKELVSLAPGEYTLFEKNSRDLTADGSYDEKVRDRAVSIFTHGQLQPASAFRDAEGGVIVFAGRTRAKAVEMIREGFQWNGKNYHNPELTLDVAVDPNAQTADEAYVNSAVENFSRNQLNPIQEAIVAETLRAEPFGWSDSKISREVFQIENTNRLAQLKKIRAGHDENTQKLVASGLLSVYPAVYLLQVPEEERAALVKSATDEDTGKIDGSIITSYLQTKHATAVETPEEEAGAAEESEGTGRSSRGPSVPKKNVKDLEKFLENLKNPDEGEQKDEKLVAVFSRLRDWFACKCKDQALLNAFEAFRS